jgi:hypothetical protein
MSNEDKKPEEEEGLTEGELDDVTGGAGAVITAQTAKTFTTTERLPGGASAIHIKSLAGSLPNGGSRVIQQKGG